MAHLMCKLMHQTCSLQPGKTLKEQAKAVAGSHIYILIHGAAMAMLLFLPKHAAIIEASPNIYIYIFTCCYLIMLPEY